MPQDPTGLPNPHIFRREALETEIAEQEKHLAESRSESTLRSSGGLALPAPSFHWDRAHPTVFPTEHKASFYPRSVGKVREFGSGRDPRNCRPYDQVYLHREALARQKHVQRF